MRHPLDSRLKALEKGVPGTTYVLWIWAESESTMEAETRAAVATLAAHGLHLDITAPNVKVTRNTRARGLATDFVSCEENFHHSRYGLRYAWLHYFPDAPYEGFHMGDLHTLIKWTRILQDEDRAAQKGSAA